MKTFILIFVFLIGKSYSQALVTPSSSIPCNMNRSIITVTLNSGQPPFTFTVQSPGCSSSFTTITSSSNPNFTLNCPGTYTFSIKDALSLNLGNYTHTVSLKTNIVLPIETEASDSICLGSSAYFIIRDSIYKYSLSQFNWSNGDTGRLILIAPTITTNYSFSALLTSDSILGVPTKTCLATGQKTIKVKICDEENVGIKTENVLEKLNVYPNPIVDKLILKYDPSIISATDLSVLNMLGGEVFILRHSSIITEIDLVALPSGFYYLIIVTNKGKKSLKILKE